MSIKISAFSKRPGQKPRHVWVSNNLEALQKNVEGYIETVTIRDPEDEAYNLVVICNEEGLLKGMEPNVSVYGVRFYGPILVVGVKDGGDNGDEFADLPYTWGELKDLYPELWEDL